MNGTQESEQAFFKRMDQERELLLRQINELRGDPTSIIPTLKQRVSQYRDKRGKSYYTSQVHKRKAIRIKHEEYPAAFRVRELAEMLEKECKPMGKLNELPKMDEVASKICQSLQDEVESQQISFQPKTTKMLRSLLDEDQLFRYPDDVVCLISICFNQRNQVLQSLLMDDDILDRSNRKYLLDPTMKCLGLCTMEVRSHPYLRCTVILLTAKADLVIPVEAIISGKGLSNNILARQQPINEDLQTNERVIREEPYGRDSLNQGLFSFKQNDPRAYSGAQINIADPSSPQAFDSSFGSQQNYNDPPIQPRIGNPNNFDRSFE